MLAIQNKSGLRVIESSRRRIPVHHRKIRPVMIGVAFNARCARCARSRIGRMKSTVLREFSCDLPMALKAPESWRLGGNYVTLHAIRVPTQALMRLGKRSWRYLRVCCAGNANGQSKYPSPSKPYRTPFYLYSFSIPSASPLRNLFWFAHPPDPHSRPVLMSDDSPAGALDEPFSGNRIVTSIFEAGNTRQRGLQKRRDLSTAILGKLSGSGVHRMEALSVEYASFALVRAIALDLSQDSQIETTAHNDVFV